MLTSFFYCHALLLLSHFSRVQLCATPYTAAYQAPPSMGVSRHEYWSGLLLPSPIAMLIALQSLILLVEIQICIFL